MFNMAVTQNIAAMTFVITALQKGPQDVRQQSGSVEPAAGDKRSDTNLAVAYFPLRRSVISPAVKNSILNAISEGKIRRHTPLAVTGYTCLLGPDQYNQTLSLQRAEAVARFLQTRGYTVGTVQGKGSQNPVTLDPSELYKNRRAEIRFQRK